MHEAAVIPVEGDLVRLKAGGPLMAVKFQVHDLLLCVWQDASGRVRRATFALHQLELVHRAEPLWIRALESLSRRWPKVALC